LEAESAQKPKERLTAHSAVDCFYYRIVNRRAGAVKRGTTFVHRLTIKSDFTPPAFTATGGVFLR
jgi:hypothetical protein